MDDREGAQTTSEEKLISRETALHLRIFFGTRAVQAFGLFGRSVRVFVWFFIFAKKEKKNIPSCSLVGSDLAVK